MEQFEKMLAFCYHILLLVMYLGGIRNLTVVCPKVSQTLCTILACNCEYKNKKLGMFNSSKNDPREKKQNILTVCNNIALLSFCDFALKGKVPVACHSFLSTWEEVELSHVGFYGFWIKAVASISN